MADRGGVKLVENNGVWAGHRPTPRGLYCELLELVPHASGHHIGTLRIHAVAVVAVVPDVARLQRVTGEQVRVDGVEGQAWREAVGDSSAPLHTHEALITERRGQACVIGSPRRRVGGTRGTGDGAVPGAARELHQ